MNAQLLQLKGAITMLDKEDQELVWGCLKQLKTVYKAYGESAPAIFALSHLSLEIAEIMEGKL